MQVVCPIMQPVQFNSIKILVILISMVEDSMLFEMKQEAGRWKIKAVL